MILRVTADKYDFIVQVNGATGNINLIGKYIFRDWEGKPFSEFVDWYRREYGEVTCETLEGDD